MHENVQVDELTKFDRSVRHRSKHRTLEAHSRNSGSSQQAGKAQELCRQMAVVENYQLPLPPQLRHCVRRNRIQAFKVQIAMYEREHAVTFCDVDDAIPI